MMIQWTGDTTEGETLNLQKFKTNSVETYECVADNGIGDALRKTITIYFSGKLFMKSSD